MEKSSTKFGKGFTKTQAAQPNTTKFHQWKPHPLINSQVCTPVADKSDVVKNTAISDCTVMFRHTSMSLSISVTVNTLESSTAVMSIGA